MRLLKIITAVLVFYPAVCVNLFALGKSDSTVKMINEKSIMVITEFNISEYPANRAAIGGVVAKKISASLDNLDYKKRGAKEYDYYWESEWSKNQREILKKISAKREERDKLIFSGVAAFQLKREQKRIDKEIKTLEEDLDKMIFTPVNIETMPRFEVSEENKKNVFPAPPESGNEYYFCKDKNADALLKAEVRDYHGRVLVEFEVWDIWSRNYSYKDYAIFSVEDIDLALSEFSAKLINNLSGMKAGAILARSNPPDANIVVDEHFAGKGKTEIIQRTPGAVDITVFADNYDTIEASIELKEDELTEAEFTLRELPLAHEDIKLKDKNKEHKDYSGSFVYKGAYFAGKTEHDTPFSLTATDGSFQQINIETKDRKYAQSVFKIKEGDTVTLTPKIPPRLGRTEKARRSFYGAFGRFWVGLPIAFMAIGYANTYISTYNTLYAYERTPERTDIARKWTYVQAGATAAIGLLAADVVVRLIIYIYQANKEGSILAGN